MSNKELFAAFDDIQRHDGETFRRKQEDYGPGNIANGWNNWGPQSLLIRMDDKMQRLINLIRGGGDPRNESVEDSLLDLANYATIMRLCMRGQWPGIEKNETQTLA
jgi:hypothetical protein